MPKGWVFKRGKKGFRAHRVPRQDSTGTICGKAALDGVTEKLSIADVDCDVCRTIMRHRRMDQRHVQLVYEVPGNHEVPQIEFTRGLVAAGRLPEDLLRQLDEQLAAHLRKWVEEFPD